MSVAPYLALLISEEDPNREAFYKGACLVALQAVSFAVTGGGGETKH
jgi:hypothetical protein